MWGSPRRGSPRGTAVADLPRMSAFRAGIALALLGGLGVFQACSTAAPSRIASVPIQTINRKFLVPVILNEGLTATFLLDTGASTTVITPDLARRIGIDTSSRTALARARIASGQEVEVSMVRMPSIRVGSARIDNLNVAVYELPVIVSANPPTTVDGFLGVDFIGRFTMTVDPKAGTLTLRPHDPQTR
jgi:hypothetical protein